MSIFKKWLKNLKLLFTLAASEGQLWICIKLFDKAFPFDIDFGTCLGIEEAFLP